MNLESKRMDSRILNAFLLQIVDQALFTIIAYEELESALSISSVTRVYYCCQSFLVATANISKILWPDKKYKQRGDTLRNLLQIDNRSPLYSRDVRNDFEHIDDRIEKLAAPTKRKGALDHPFTLGLTKQSKGKERLYLLYRIYIKPSSGSS